MSKAQHRLLLISALLACSCSAHAVPPALDPSATAVPAAPPDLLSPATIDAGRALFESKGCPQCHGIGGQGGVRLAGNALTPETAYLTIANGRIRGAMRMPMWKGILSDEAIWQLAAYVMSLQGP